MAPTITLEEFTASMERLASGDLFRSITSEATEAGIFAKGRAIVYSTQRLNVRSGRLRQSIAYQVKTHPKRVAVHLTAGGHTNGRPVPYAAVQDLGATITPKRSRFLTVPAKGGPAEAASGDLRRSARSFGDLLRPHRFASGKMALVSREPTARGGLQVYFWLVRSVTIKPTYFMRDAFDDMQGEISIRLRSIFVQRRIAGG